MHYRLLKTRPGFTLIEALVALVMTAIIGAAVTGVFVAQSTFFDQQEKLGSARAVSRGASNMMLSELRMVERTGGIPASTPPTNTKVTLRVPYSMGVSCVDAGTLISSRLPVHPFVISDAGYSGYAYRDLNGNYTYVEGGAQPANEPATACTAVNVAILPGGNVRALAPGTGVVGGIPPGSAVFIYQIITYEIKASTLVPGTLGLWRKTEALNRDEELVAPLGNGAMFRFYVNDAAVAQDAVPADLSTITGLELVLNGLSERPGADGTLQTVPFETSVFFRNRQ